MSYKILTVDDSKSIRSLVSKTFAPYNCEVIKAADGSEGVQLARSEAPDLILLDITMPVLDGVGALKALKEDPDTRSIPVIMLTAESGKETVMQIARLGVRDYVVKPFVANTLIDKVKRVLPIDSPKSAQAAPTTMNDPCTLLVVDDKGPIIEKFQELTPDNWNVRGAPDQSAALELAKTAFPHAIVLSLALKNGDPKDFLRQLRLEEAHRTTPLIGLCVKTAAEAKNEATKLGFTAFIHKPLNKEEIIDSISKSLNLDPVQSLFSKDATTLRINFPQNLSNAAFSSLTESLPQNIGDAVEEGLASVTLDLTSNERTDVEIAKLVQEAFSLSNDLGIDCQLLIDDGLMSQYKDSFAEAASWLTAAPELVKI